MNKKEHEMQQRYWNNTQSLYEHGESVSERTSKVFQRRELIRRIGYLQWKLQRASSPAEQSALAERLWRAGAALLILL